MKYYHGSHTLYDFPSFAMIDNWTKDDERASKVMFGYYVTTERSMAESCGKYLYEIELIEDVAVWKYPLHRLRQLYDSFADWSEEETKQAWIELREDMAVGVGIVHIVERDGRVGESVIINLGAIRSFRCVTSP